MKIRHPEKENKPINPIKKKPEWIRSKLTNSKEFFLTKTIVNNNNLVTVCQEANCPNITECWSKRHATFMIMGDTCTRACAFCDVKTGKPESLDLIHSGFFLIGFTGLFSFSGCLLFIFFNYINSLIFFTKQKSFPN